MNCFHKTVNWLKPHRMTLDIIVMQYIRVLFKGKPSTIQRQPGTIQR